jgi:hypothetical protein
MPAGTGLRLVKGESAVKYFGKKISQRKAGIFSICCTVVAGLFVICLYLGRKIPKQARIKQQGGRNKAAFLE